jgi:hypothetical protein
MRKAAVDQVMPSLGQKEVSGDIIQQPDGVGPVARPRRPQSAFETFVQYEQPLLAEKHGEQNMTSTSISKFLEVQWQSMEHWRKDVYIRLAQSDRERYVKEIKEWKANQRPEQGSVAAYLRAKLVKPAPQKAQCPMSLPSNFKQNLPCGMPLALPPPIPQTSRQSTVPMLETSTRILKRDLSCSSLPCEPNSKYLRTESHARPLDSDFDWETKGSKASLGGDDLDGSVSDKYFSLLVDLGLDVLF